MCLATCVSLSSNIGRAGPLGHLGPLTPKEVYVSMYHLNELLWGANEFPHALDAPAPWGVLGPLGPLGPLGICT